MIALLAMLLAPVHVLTLDEALQSARQNQPQLRQSGAAVASANARYGQARSALLPQLQGSGSYRRSIVGSDGALGFSGGESWNLQLGASQLLFDVETFDRVRAASVGAAASRQSDRDVKLRVDLDVRDAFFSAHEAKALLGVAKDTLANQDKHLAQIQGFVDVGNRPRLDLARARTEHANARVQEITAEGNYDTAKAELNVAMGVDGTIDYDVSDQNLPPVEGEDQTTEALLAEAAAARPALRALALQTRQQRLLLQSVTGTYLPALSASAQLNDGGRRLGDLEPSGSAGLTLSWSIFQGGLTRAQMQEARSSVTAIDAELTALRLQVRLEVDQARVAVRTAKATLSASEDALAAAQEGLSLAEGRYQTGVGNIIELSDAQLALTNASAQKVTAEFKLSSARAQLLEALGRD